LNKQGKGIRILDRPDYEERTKRTRHLVRGVDDLLRLTSSTDLADLASLIEGRLTTEGGPCCELTRYETALGILVEEGLFDLEFPCTLSFFWQIVDMLDADAEHRHEARYLPHPDDTEPDEDCSAHLARFFEVAELQFVKAIGCGWRVQDRNGLCGLNENCESWFVSGVPDQVLLGIGVDTANVSIARPGGGGLGEPSHLEQECVADVYLRTRRTLRELSLAVTNAQQQRQAEFGFCPLCRTLQPMAVEDRPCSACLERHFGYIFC
jgi:hypothetical protein